MQDSDTPQVFISYAFPDQERVTPFFDALEKKGFNVWYDCKRLKPGQNWDFEVKRALEKSSIVIAFLSEKSIARRGYVQKELRLALDKLSEKLIDDIYIVPVLLDDDITVPDQLKGIQSISASAENCVESVEGALTFQLSKLGVETLKVQRIEELSWSFHTQKEIWDGLPGYEVELQFIKLRSSKYPALYQAGEYVRGELLKHLFYNRRTKLDQLPAMYNYGQDRYRRTDTYDAHCSDPLIKGRVMTILYAIHWYGAGAAHPNMHFCTYSFVMEPLILIESLEQIFLSSSQALSKIQESVRSDLKSTRVEGADEDGDPYLDPEKIDSGTSKWSDFRSFVFKEAGVEFLFSPYQVAGYPCGPQFAEVPYSELIEYIRPEYQSALGLEHVAFRKEHSNRIGAS